MPVGDKNENTTPAVVRNFFFIYEQLKFKKFIHIEI
jgi:hypothetical protein